MKRSQIFLAFLIGIVLLTRFFQYPNFLVYTLNWTGMAKFLDRDLNLTAYLLVLSIQIGVFKLLLILSFPACFSIPIFFSKLNSSCSNLVDMRNLPEEVKKTFFFPEIVLTFHCLNELF